MRLLWLLGSVALESIVSVIFTLLLFDPVGSLSLESCGVERISDWYTMFYNPAPDYVHSIHCTQEAVYPL